MFTAPTDNTAALARRDARRRRAGMNLPDGCARPLGPAAVGVDVGSASTRIWLSGHGRLRATNPTPAAAERSAAVVRGRIIDAEAVRAVLSGLLRDRQQPLPTGVVVVACRPVGSNAQAELALREVLTSVLEPARLLIVDTVRAAAMGSGAAAGPLLIADVGARLTEIAVLSGGVIVAARRHDVGLHDDDGGTDPDAAIIAAVTDLIGQVRRQAGHRQAIAAAVRGGLLLVGGGAARPRLAARIAGAAGTSVRSPAAPHVAAVRGAGLAALSVLRHDARRP
ncbi:cell shape-determining protein MreB [Dactylosporangium sp. NPDC005572]|uniref:cell shape-determining protein MreB n=1 Tax=Dactylosporangium sp. NPDC005572 TaxID=3156889 RepID=UPI0033A27801